MFKELSSGLCNNTLLIDKNNALLPYALVSITVIRFNMYALPTIIFAIFGAKIWFPNMNLLPRVFINAW